MVIPDTQTCLTAMRSRDARFDGRFYTAVRTTGIYCRPSCPALIEMIAMRALGDPDAFPAADLGVRKSLAELGLTSKDAQAWRPWRSYATQYLWALSDHPTNQLPGDQP